MTTTIDWEEIRKRYEATKPFKETPGDTTWVDRLYTWEDFLKNGPYVAKVLKDSSKSMVNYEAVVDLNPNLYALLMEVFG